MLKGINKNRFFLPSAILFGLSVFTYNSARIFVPLFLLSFLIIYWKKLKIDYSSVISSLIFGIFLAGAFYLAVFQDSSARYYWVRILDEGAISFLDQARNNSQWPSLITNLIYNRPAYFISHFTLNYLKHLSFQFLTLSGGTNYQFSLPDMGLIYFIELPFLLYGFYKSLKTKIGWIFLSWFLIAPIPSALTREAPHALRSIFMLGSLQVLVSWGILQFFNLLHNKKSLVKPAGIFITFLIIANMFFLLKKLFY